jgi:hypothetical protein
MDVEGMDGALPQLTIGDGEELATSVEENCEDEAGVNTIEVLKLETVDDAAELEKVEGMLGVGEALDELELADETAGVELATIELDPAEDDLTEVANVDETFELASCPLH